jgi:hypothetical protein
MQMINNLTDNADQLTNFTLPDATVLQLEFIYRPGIARWHMHLTHPLLTLRGVNLVVSPNILRPWKNIIPFGMAILSTTGLDPMNVTDLSDGTVSVNILSAAEVLMVEQQILAPIPLVNP